MVSLHSKRKVTKTGRSRDGAFCGCVGSWMMGEKDMGKDIGTSRSILGDRSALSRAAKKGPHVRVEPEKED